MEVKEKIIHFVTGNLYKFQVAQKALEGTGIELVQEKLDTPEIQSTSVEEISAYSAKWAAEKIGKPVAITDAGYYIEALNGFPGPFIKYINQWLTSEDLINLMVGIKNRKVIVRDGLSYCEPGKDPVTFIGETFGTIALHPVITEKPGSTSINEIFIPEGYGIVETEISKEDMIEFWSKSDPWKKLAQYITTLN